MEGHTKIELKVEGGDGVDVGECESDVISGQQIRFSQRKNVMSDNHSIH